MIRRGRSTPKGESPFEWLRTDQLIPMWRKLQRELEEQWQRIAAQKVRNPTMLARLQESMKISRADASNGELLRLEVTGMWGPAIEFGWAPVGADFMSGVGEYDGAYHDLRPFMLGGEDHRAIRISHSLSKHKPAFAEQSPMQFFAERAQMALTPARQGNRKDKFYRTHTDPLPSEQVTARRRARMANILADAANWDAPARADSSFQVQVPSTYLDAPTSKRRPNYGTVDYGASILKGMTVSSSREPSLRPHFGARQGLGGNVASVVRTISRYNSDPNTWFSRGIEPANTLEDVSDVARELLAEAFTPRG